MALDRDGRPWGHYEVLVDAPDHKVKEIVVRPGCRLSYQLHHRRSEHWFVVQGHGTVILDGVPRAVRRAAAVDVPVGVAHRIDDIVRLEDDFGRADQTAV